MIALPFFISALICFGVGKAFLAYCISDGSVGVIVVTQSLGSIPTKSGFGDDYDVDISHELHGHRPSGSDGRGITALSWIEMPTKNVYRFLLSGFLLFSCILQLILVYCKPGMVHLWSALSHTANRLPVWSGSRTILLQTQRVSVGSSSLYPVSGMIYIRSHDAIVLCLFDGSFHAIHGLSIDPSYFPPTSSSVLIGGQLSATARSIFSQAEMKNIQHTDVNRTSGMMSYDGSSTVVWAHEYVSFTQLFHILC
jgi:general transcription factor 3C polypeptide 4